MSDGRDIAFESVSFQYPNADRAVLRDFDWEVGESELVLLAGESGSGKSTILRCLNGLVPHFSGGSFGGRVLIRGEDTRLLPTRALARSVGFVFQDPGAHSVSTTVEDEVAFGLEQLGVPVPSMRRRVEEALDLTGTERLRKRAIATLSGGERQRVAIAAALALQPRILALDEPTSQLDPSGAEDVLDAVRQTERRARDHGRAGRTTARAGGRICRPDPVAAAGLARSRRTTGRGIAGLRSPARSAGGAAGPFGTLGAVAADGQGCASHGATHTGFVPQPSPVDPPRPDTDPAIVVESVVDRIREGAGAGIGVVRCSSR